MALPYYTVSAQCLIASLVSAFFIVHAFDRAREAHNPKIVGPSSALLLFVDVSPSSEFRRWRNVGPSLVLLLDVDVRPSSEFRRWPNHYGCVGILYPFKSVVRTDQPTSETKSDE